MLDYLTKDDLPDGVIDVVDVIIYVVCIIIFIYLHKLSNTN